MRRYELIDGASQKFWEITLDGDKILRRWGRLGTSGQKQTKSFPDQYRARKAWEELISKKRSKGYRLVEEAPEMQESPEVEDAGAVDAPERNPELEALIYADPEVRDGYLVLGDWLLEQECPRGALISANAQMVDQNDPVQFLRFKKVQEKLLSENPNLFYGPRLKRYTDNLRITWLLGFWRTVRVQGGSAGLPTNLRDFIASVAASPSALFLQSLELQLGGVENNTELYTCLDGLDQHPMRALSTLKIGAPALSGVEVLGKACPVLRHLHLDVRVLKVSPVRWSLSSLHSLYLDLDKSDHKDVRRLLDAVASVTLTEMELRDINEERANSLLASAAMASLNKLTIEGCYAPRLLRAFVECHHHLGALKALQVTIQVDPNQRDEALEREFTALYPFADLQIYQDSDDGEDRYDEGGE